MRGCLNRCRNVSYYEPNNVFVVNLLLPMTQQQVSCAICNKRSAMKTSFGTQETNATSTKSCQHPYLYATPVEDKTC